MHDDVLEDMLRNGLESISAHPRTIGLFTCKKRAIGGVQIIYWTKSRRLKVFGRCTCYSFYGIVGTPFKTGKKDLLLGNLNFHAVHLLATFGILCVKRHTL